LVRIQNLKDGYISTVGLNKLEFFINYISACIIFSQKYLEVDYINEKLLLRNEHCRCIIFNPRNSREKADLEAYANDLILLQEQMGLKSE